MCEKKPSFQYFVEFLPMGIPIPIPMGITMGITGPHLNATKQS